MTHCEELYPLATPSLARVKDKETVIFVFDAACDNARNSYAG